MPEIKAIIFDLDGTLIDSGRDLAASVNHTLRCLKLKPRSLEEVSGFVGDGVKKLIERALGREHLELTETALELFTVHYQKHCTDHTRLYPGVKEGLKLLAPKFRMAVLTNKNRNFSLKILQELEIADYFDPVLGGDSLPTRKPDPAGIFHLAGQWHLNPDQLIMVGDHHTDIQTGINGGCATIFFTGGIGETGGLVPAGTINSLAELPGILAGGRTAEKEITPPHHDHA